MVDCVCNSVLLLGDVVVVDVVGSGAVGRWWVKW